jgi:hypothetical protein
MCSQRNHSIYNEHMLLPLAPLLLTKQAICRNMQELQMQLANMHNAKLALSDGVEDSQNDMHK